MSSKIIDIYTDGAARGNPGPGGWATLLSSGEHYKELSGGFKCTTNNRMELLAVIKGLEAIKRPNAQIRVWSDSTYVCNAINKGWLFDWEKKGFRKKKNVDLWLKFLPLYRQHRVTMHWIRGHSGHPQNERCDELAVAASHGVDLPIDVGYMESNPDCGATDENLLL